MRIQTAHERADDFDRAQRASQGDAEAFGDIYKRTHQFVLGVCYKVIGNLGEAEEVTQDVYIHLLRKLHLFKGESAFTTWLYMVALNESRMYLRRQAKKLECSTNLDVALNITTLGTGNPRKMSVMDHLALTDALIQLPTGYRKVLMLHDLEGFEHSEVAEILGCSIGTSKSQLFKARIKLKKLLNKKCNPKLPSSSLFST
jgi:RNA polymerase sigma-70 factor, ECF subfamily